MCGIFGIISKHEINKNELEILIQHSEQRGKDSSGFCYSNNHKLKIIKGDIPIRNLYQKIKKDKFKFCLGHSRLITNGLSDNQPIIKNDTIVFHNGIIVYENELWKQRKCIREYEIDTEIINAVYHDFENNFDLASRYILDNFKGIVSAAVLLKDKSKLILISNNGSLYRAKKDNDLYFSSEYFPLSKIDCQDIVQLNNSYEIYDIDVPNVKEIEKHEIQKRTVNLIPGLILKSDEEKLLVYPKPNLKRCTKCILPETMPFITFNSDGICNYCLNYKLRNIPKPKSEILKLIEPYRKKEGNECIIPLSGGRDSCYAMHLVVKELGLRAVSYTYDWGMVTDLARRNISRMCSQLHVENIIIADDINKKRKFIRWNLEAWLKSPHLGLIALLTAGDKHFFRYVELVKRQTGIKLNLWGINPLEQTHFKTGFLGIKPDFEEKRVYSHGALKQIRYHTKRFAAMIKSPGYFNISLWDTLSGEYYRSFHKKKDYFHVYDYWKWDENEISNLLINEYNWEVAPDTKSTWRIGDGTAAFYNYVYYTLAGFTEHDTFRSNQIREGQMTRDEALRLVEIENQPRYPNIKWYLDVLGMDFERVIKIINNTPKLY